MKIKIKIEPLFLSHNEYQAAAHATTVYQPPGSRSTKAYSENQVEVLYQICQNVLSQER